MTTFAGRFIWRELATPDPAAAAAFYSGLCGWSHQTMDVGGAPYTMFQHATLDESTAGAMQPMMEGAPAAWVDYITVDDIDAAHAQVTALGGQTLTEVMAGPGLRFAIVQDPAGAVFGLVQSETPGASDTDRRPPVGTFCWSQLMTNDLAKVIPFYTGLFGWTVSEMPGGMTVFHVGDQAVASAMPLPEGMDALPHWLAYIAVDDADTSTAEATALGATVMAEPQTIPGMGRFSVFADPTGAVVALWKDLGAQS